MDIFGNLGHLRDAQAATEPEDDHAHRCPTCGHVMVATPTGRYVCTNAPGHAKAPADDP
jgi:hypothetical protein